MEALHQHNIFTLQVLETVAAVVACNQNLFTAFLQILQ